MVCVEPAVFYAQTHIAETSKQEAPSSWVRERACEDDLAARLMRLLPPSMLDSAAHDALSIEGNA